MDRVRRFSVVLAVAVLAAAVFAPLALAAKASPSPALTLKAKPATVELGAKVVFSGAVKHAVAKDRTVKLRLVEGKKTTLEKSAAMSSKDAFRFVYKTAKAGTWKFEVTYKVGKKTYRSPVVTIEVEK